MEGLVRELLEEVPWLPVMHPGIERLSPLAVLEHVLAELESR